MHHHLMKVRFVHGNENKKNTCKSFFLNTAEHIAPIVNKPDDTDKKEIARLHEVLASHDPEYQQKGHIL